MVKTLKQARKIQERRVSGGMYGYAKAVRRFLQREHKDDYLIQKRNLPAVFPKKRPASDEDYIIAA